MAGLGVGYLSGLVGVGGGFLLTPVLHVLFGIPLPIAVGSGLAQMIAVGAGAAYRHGRAGFVDMRLAGWMAPGVVIGTFFGKGIMDTLGRVGHVLLFGHDLLLLDVTSSGLFVLLLFAVAGQLWQERGADDIADVPAGTLCWSQGPWCRDFPRAGLRRVSILSLLASGVGIGVLAGLLGVGGGVLLIPLLVYGYGVTVRLAIGTSALLVLVSAVVGTTLHALAGHVHLPLVITLALGALLGVQVGTWHSLRLPAAHLCKALALLALLVAGMVLCQLVRGD